MSSTPRRLAAVAAAGLMAIAVPAGAGAATAPTDGSSSPLLALTFVPPKVGPISVSIGPTILGGQVIDPGLHVTTPGVSLPPISWTPPALGSTPSG
jgi:hypothetical protein